uniref:Uncharacterized protein n=1 Tax=Oryza glaberrima TaxID=4538 RepID=I1PJF3_ORYGL
MYDKLIFYLFIAGNGIINGNNKKNDYDPQCDMSKEEIEWRCAQAEKVRQRMPQVEHQLRNELGKMRYYFLGDPSALKCWDLHMDNVHRAFSEKLPDSLSSPRYTPNSVLYKQLMKRKARPKTFACVLSGGWYKLKEVSRNKMVRRSLPLAGVAAVFVAGLAVGYTLGKEQEINET